MGGGEHEESVDVLLAKLAKKGKKIKILDDNATNDDGDTVRGSVIDEVDDEDLDDGGAVGSSPSKMRGKNTSTISVISKGG
jgi:hypothetical protein